LDSSSSDVAVCAGQAMAVAGVGSQRIRVALIGTGRGARENYAPLILQNSNFHLRALWSRTKASAESFNLEVAGLSLEVFWGDEGFAQLLNRPDIEGFAVVLPAAVQSSYVEQIRHQRRHVLSEKPVTADWGSAKEKLKQIESDSEGPIWHISSRLRHEPVFQAEHLRLHELGQVVAAECFAVLVVDSSAPSPDESLWIQGGVQHIAMLRHILGSITEVNCTRISEHSSRPGHGEDFWADALSGTLRFENGAVCVVNWQTSDSCHDERLRLTLRCARGSLTIELDTGGTGLRRYNMRRSGNSVSALLHSFTPCGAERQLEAWGAGIRAFRQGVDSCKADSPLHAMVDLFVVGAMLQSAGTPTLIRTKKQQRK